MRVESWEVILEEFDAFVVDFYGFEFALFLGEKLREDAHSGTDFEDGNVGTGIDGVSDAAGDVKVAEEVLTEVFLGFHQFHGCKITIFFCDFCVFEIIFRNFATRNLKSNRHSEKKWEKCAERGRFARAGRCDSLLDVSWF